MTFIKTEKNFGKKNVTEFSSPGILFLCDNFSYRKMSHKKFCVTFFKLAICIGKNVTDFPKFGKFNFHVTIFRVVGKKGWLGGQALRGPPGV